MTVRKFPMTVHKYYPVLLALALAAAGIVAGNAAGERAPGPLAIAK